jgi:hypothetical protein
MLGSGPVSSFGYELSLEFIDVEARIEARLSKLETRVSSIKLRDSIQTSSPLNVKLTHETGFVTVAVTQNSPDFYGSSVTNPS